MKTEILPIRLEKKVKDAFQKSLKNDENMSWLIRKFIRAYLKDQKAVREYVESKE